MTISTLCCCSNPNPSLLLHHSQSPPSQTLRPRILLPHRNLTVRLSAAPERPLTWTHIAATASAFLSLFLALSFPAASAIPPLLPESVSSQTVLHDDDSGKGLEDEERNSAFEAWKSKTYALSVPLRIVALRNSIPPSWAKDFMQSQGKRLRLRTQFLGSLENIFSDLAMPFNKKNVKSTSTVTADIVSVGDSWLSIAIKKGLIEPIEGVEDQDWFHGLSDKWKIYLRRNHDGEIDPEGKIWAAPYRWGTMVIAYKKSKFKKHKLAPIEDWADLWRPELAGRISMVDSPREIVGAVLKYMGASYNKKNIFYGGRDEVEKNLALLSKQIRLFDSMHYLKAFGVGDVWVAVGWSSDVLPVAKRMSNVTVVVPKSGTSLWADLWAIPAASRLATETIGGRVRGPSPLIHQWIEFCLQSARALPFKQEVIPGAIPAALGSTSAEVPLLTNKKPRLDTNLIAGVPPPEILSRCEFLEPLSDATLSDYMWLIDRIKNQGPGLIRRIQNRVSSEVKAFWLRPH